MNATVDFQNQIVSSDIFVPTQDQIDTWVNGVCEKLTEDVELTIRITDEEEMLNLNSTYRGKSYATNVLSFPADIPEELEIPLLGDIVICAGVVNKEAEEQSKLAEAHWAHMVIHGTLHLLGYDHIVDSEAEEMESKEIMVLQQLGFKNPYLITENK